MEVSLREVEIDVDDDDACAGIGLGGVLAMGGADGAG